MDKQPTSTAIVPTGMRAGLLPRKQAAKAANMSIRSLRRLEGTALHPTIDEDGQYWYDAAEIARIATRDSDSSQHADKQRTEGQIASAAYALFRMGKTPNQVVEALELPPDIVKRLYASWVEFERGLYTSGTERAELERELGEPVASTARLLAFVRHLMRTYRTLLRFTYDCPYCGKPVQAQPDREWAQLLEMGRMTTPGHQKCADAVWK